MSLITGAMRSHNLLVREPAESTCGTSVVLRNQTMTLANASSAGTFSYCTFERSLQKSATFKIVGFFSASFLGERSWRGLEQKLGETPVVKAARGRKGIAIAYEEEGTSQ